MTNTDVAERTISPITELRTQVENLEGQFKAALPAHIPVERFCRVLMTAIQNNPDLVMKVERRSLFNAAMRAAQDGLLPDGRDGAIVVYGTAAQWMPMIGGLRKKVRNSGEIATWDAQVVHKNDKFQFRLGDDPFIQHEPILESDPGPVVAAYSIAVLKTGEKSREVMSVAAIEKVRSRSKAKNNGPWVTDYEEMCRKTVARRHSKVLPMSTDLDDLIRRDDDLYEFDSAASSNATGAPQTLAGKLDVLAQLPAGEAPSVADTNSTASTEPGAHSEAGAGTAEEGHQPGPDTSSADKSSSTQQKPNPGEAATGRAAPDDSKPPKEESKGAAKAGEKKDPANEAEYITHARGWIAALDDGAAGKKRWADEKGLRNKSHTGGDAREMLQAELDKKIGEIADAEKD